MPASHSLNEGVVELSRMPRRLSIGNATEKKNHLFEGFSIAQQMSPCNQVAPSGLFLKGKSNERDSIIGALGAHHWPSPRC